MLTLLPLEKLDKQPEKLSECQFISIKEDRGYDEKVKISQRKSCQQ